MEIEQKEDKRLKIMIIIGLILILFVVLYFRVFQKKQTGPGEVKTAAQPALALPALPAAGPPAQKTEANESFQQAMTRDVTRDIFEPGRSVREADRARKDVAEPAVAPQPIRLVLSGVIYSGENSVAIINGQFQHVGDRIGGYRIVRIEPKGVSLKGEDREIRLEVVDYGK